MYMLISCDRSNSTLVMQLAVDVKDPKDLPKLVEGLRRLSQSDLGVQTMILDTGEHALAGDNEDHLKAGLKDLSEVHACIPIRTRDITISYRESILETSRMTATSRSPNKQSCLYFTATPLSEGVSCDIDSGKIGANDDPKARARILVDEHG
jgi:elongation factor 2